MLRQVVHGIVLWTAGFIALPSAVAQVSGAISLAADFSCGDTTPSLGFTPEDFKQGFRRTYQFPGTERCELGVGGKRGGTITLTYRLAPNPVVPLVPDPLAPLVPQPENEEDESWQLRAEIDYWQEMDKRASDDDPPNPCRTAFHWDGELVPSDTDPEGVLPAASFGESRANPTVSIVPGCEEGGQRNARLHVRLVLLRHDEASGAIDRTPHLVMSGDFFGGAIVFGPILPEPPLPPPDPPAPTAQCMDTDDDGVCDELDECPDTPAGKKVDEVGCPLRQAQDVGA